MDAVVAFIANGEATKPVEPGERPLDDPAEHAFLTLGCALIGWNYLKSTGRVF